MQHPSAIQTDTIGTSLAKRDGSIVKAELQEVGEPFYLRMEMALTRNDLKEGQEIELPTTKSACEGGSPVPSCVLALSPRSLATPASPWFYASNQNGIDELRSIADFDHTSVRCCGASVC